MSKKQLPTPELLRKLLRYDPATGKLFWRVRTLDVCSSEKSMRAFNSRYAGKEAFTALRSGYPSGSILGKTYLAHRVIWAMETGEWPKYQIDHINHDRADNRMSNLRDVTAQENFRNLSMFSNNTSGTTGVYWNKQYKKWHATIRRMGSTENLGLFSDIDEAIEARKMADKRYGFHENHGAIQSGVILALD